MNRGARPPFGPMMPMRGPNLYQPMMGHQMNRGTGGILSKLFSKSGGVSAARAPGIMGGLANQTASQGTGGFLGKLLSTSGGPTGILDNIQRVIGVANQVGPMVQQYGPIVKNIPALIKLYSELNSSDDEVQDQSSDAKLEEKEVPKPKVDTTPKSKGNTQKGSQPRLYI